MGHVVWRPHGVRGNTVKPVLSGHSKEDKKNRFFKTDNRLMQVKSNAECSHGAFCSTFDLHSDTKWLSDLCFVYIFEWPLKTGFTVALPFFPHSLELSSVLSSMVCTLIAYIANNMDPDQTCSNLFRVHSLIP